ncbi:MAG: hypothetical protein Ta2B_03520 [Termitinemataceae bacterium]|nr:MAG: hypothetical protein Ta2B_03520 [Termitinemataceae bacterium]
MAVMTNENDKVTQNKKLSGDISHAVNTVLKYHQNDRTLVVAYEAGCMGYTLQRAFASVNIQCLVLPANKVRNQKFYFGGLTRRHIILEVPFRSAI